MWPAFAKYEEYYDFTVSKVMEENRCWYTLTMGSPIPIPGIIRFKNSFYSSVKIFFTHASASERVQASGDITLMQSPCLVAGGTDVFTIYQEALLPAYSKHDVSPIHISTIHMLCKPASPMWANTSLSEFAIFHRICASPTNLTWPQPPQLLFQDRCERPGTLIAKEIYVLLNSIAGAQYYLEQVQELSRNAQVSALSKLSASDHICTDPSKYKSICA